MSKSTRIKRYSKPSLATRSTYTTVTIKTFWNNRDGDDPVYTGLFCLTRNTCCVKSDKLGDVSRSTTIGLRPYWPAATLYNMYRDAAVGCDIPPAYLANKKELLIFTFQCVKLGWKWWETTYTTTQFRVRRASLKSRRIYMRTALKF